MNIESLRLVVFEPESRKNFEPVSITRPIFDLLQGSKTLLERVESKLGKEASALIVRNHLENVCKEIHPHCEVNLESSSPSLLVNPLISPEFDIRRAVEDSIRDSDSDFLFCDSNGTSVFAVVQSFDLKRTLPSFRRLRVRKIEQQVCFVFPWQLVSQNGVAISHDFTLAPQSSIRRNMKDGEFLGSRLSVSEKAEVDRFVTLDSREGPVIVDEGAQVQSFSHLTGPCYIGRSTIVKSARIREGTTIGKQCRVGGEIEATIFHEYSNKNHDGFIGHSIIGSWVNLGALTTNSDLKNTYGEIKVNVAGKQVRTNETKVGCFIADMCKTSIGTLIFSGKTIGVSSNLFGVVNRDVPSFTNYAESFGALSRENYIESAIETQRRMMDRRLMSMTFAYEKMIESVFSLTSKDRSAFRVRRGKFKI